MDLSNLDTNLHHVLYVLGGIYTIVLLLKLSYFLWTYIKPSSLSRYKHGNDKSWALVTGATDGIGRCFAIELSKKGFSVLLHGRNPSKLARVKSEIQSLVPNAAVSTIMLDASTFTASDISSMVQTVSELDGKFTILVNNVGGVSYFPTIQLFSTLSTEDIDRTIDMCARFPIQLTRALLPLLSKNQPSLVLNVGSMAGIVGTAFATTYAACKAFNHAFSISLASEMRLDHSPNIEVLGFLAGAVQTTKHQVSVNLFTPTADTLAKAALRRVGCGERIVHAYFWHAVQMGLFHLAPDWIRDAMTRGEMVQKREDEKRWKNEGWDGRPEEKIQ